MSDFADKVRSLGVISRRSGPVVSEGRDEAGNRTRSTLDELGNTVVEHADKADRVDVHIQAPQITVRAKTQEIRVTDHGR